MATVTETREDLWGRLPTCGGLLIRLPLACYILTGPMSAACRYVGQAILPAAAFAGGWTRWNAGPWSFYLRICYRQMEVWWGRRFRLPWTRWKAVRSQDWLPHNWRRNVKHS